MRESINSININSLFFFVVFFKSYSFLLMRIGLGTYSEDYEEKGVCSLEGQRVVSLHTLMRLWGWRGGWWSAGAGTSVWLDPLGGRRKDKDRELKAPQLCKCRSSWACFLRLPMIFCDCAINYVKNMKKTKHPNVIQFSDFSLSTKHK